MPKTLKTKMTLVVSLLVAGVLAATMLTTLWYLANEFVRTVSRQQWSVVSIMADEVDSKIRLTQRQLATVAKTVTAADLATPQRASRFLQRQPDELEAFDNGIGLMSCDGKLLATIPAEPQYVGKNFSYQEHIRKTIETGKPVISRPFLSSRSHRHPVVTFTEPILDSQGRVTAILWGSHDLIKPNFLGRLASSRLGEHGFLYLCNNERTVMVHPDGTRLLKKVPPGANRLLDAAITGFEGTGETVDDRGRHLLSSFKRLKSADWILAANYLQSEAYAPLQKATWYLLSAIVVAICCSIPVTWLFMRHLTAPLVAFIDHVQRITGNEHEPEPIRIETNDEIGTLALAFNRMVQEAHRQKQAAQAQEAFSENLLQNSSVATYVLDFQHRVIMWNRACEELTGVRAAQVVGTDEAWKAFYPEKRPVLADFVLDGNLASLSTYYRSSGCSPLVPGGLTAEGWFPGLCGSERFLCFDAAPILDADQNVIAAIQTLRDITERKQAEESLQKLSLAIEQMPVTVMITDRDGIIEYVNPHFTKVTGYRAEEAIGRNPNMVKSGDHPAEFFRDLWTTILSGREWRGELRNKRKNGEIYWEAASISLVKDRCGEIRHFVAVKEDITERKRAEEALRRKDEQIRLLLESTAEAIYGIDLTGACTFANPSCAKLLGFRDANELLGKNMHGLIHHTRLDGSPYLGDDCPLCHVLEGESGVHVTDEVFWRADGSSFAVEYWSYPQMRDGELVGGVVTFFDVTERRRVEEEVRRASAAAEAAALAKSDFLANMSHEIRTPLNAALGMLYLLQQTGLSDQQKNYLDKAQTASTMLLKLINDILDFSKIEAGKLELENAPFRLAFVLNDLATVATATLQNKPIRLQVDVAPEVPELLVGDPLRLSQVLLNLTSNAVKFTEAGKIEVGVTRVEAGDGEVTLRFAVTDTGIGIPADKQATLFSAFTQADNSTTRRYGGTGLGLAISKDLVELMGGSISVASREGEGSTFSFTAVFELQTPEQAQQAQRARDAAPVRTEACLAGARILLVEDTAISQEVARELLERRGAQVDLAENGAEALEKLERNPGGYHAVLMDVHMPVMDGIEATRRIRLNPAFGRLPVIAMTANAMAQERAACMEAGMTDQVNKPLDVEEFFATLKRWLDAAHADAAPPVQEKRESGLPDLLPGIDVGTAMRIVESLPLLKRLMRTFRNENAATMERLEEKLAAGDLESARGMVHSLRGVGGNLGFTGLFKAASALEKPLKEGDADAARAILPLFGEKLEEVLSSIATLEQEGALDPPEGVLTGNASDCRHRLETLARELSLHLEAHNLNAFGVWEQMRPMLTGEVANRLEATLHCLDFEDAARLLDELMEELEIGR